MRNHHLRLKHLATVFLLVATLLPTTPAAARSASCTREGAALQLLSALSCLTVRADYTGTYNRSAQFGSSWTDDDHDGLDTRAEVLINESTTTVVMNTSGVTVKSGRWYSLYDNKVVSIAIQLDVDHMVPLAEVWRSGSASWTLARRKSYANDLGVGWTLRAVSLGENRSKSDDDPSLWMPPYQGSWCTYLVEWVDVKIRWGLSMNSAEKTAIRDNWMSAGCSNRANPPKVRVRLAP
ncbi:MAG: hypothetical protein RIQ87_768 [Chloroflexota bacterium]|jgi:hypothetical protein